MASEKRVDEHVGSRIKFRRMSLKLTQDDLGTAVGVPSDQIASFEEGRERPDATLLMRIAGELKEQVSHFFEGLAQVAPEIRNDDASEQSKPKSVTRPKQKSEH